jgi:hypothetical protein
MALVFSKGALFLIVSAYLLLVRSFLDAFVVGHAQNLLIASLYAEAMHLPILEPSRKYFMLVVEVSHTCVAMLEVIKELSLIKELLGLELAAAMLLSLVELPIVVVPVDLLESTATVVSIISDSTLVASAVGSDDDAFVVLFDVVAEGSFIDVSVLVPEYALAVLLAALEATFISVASFVADLSLAIEDSINEGSFIVEALPASFHLHHRAMAIEQSCFELSRILRSICILQLPIPVEFVPLEVPFVDCPIGSAYFSLSRLAAILEGTGKGRSVIRGDFSMEEDAGPE